MAHIHTNPGEHDLTVSAFIVRTDFDEPKIMLHMHKKLGKWLQFGGHVELNENPWQALTHELMEESGYQIDRLKLIEIAESPNLDSSTEHPIPFSVNTHAFSETHNHTDLAYAFTADEAPSSKPLENESTNIRLFTRIGIMALSENEIFEGTKRQCLFVFDKVLPKA